MKNIYKSEAPKQNLTLFGGNEVKEKTIISKKKIKQARKGIKTKPLTNVMKELKDEVEIPRDVLIEFEKLDDYEKLKVEEQAVKLCSENTRRKKLEVIVYLKQSSKIIYLNTIKKYIERVLDGNY